MKRHIALVALLLISPLAACNPHVTIDQTKPMEININFTGKLDLVIHDARQDMETITGEKPVNTVRPEDLGLAPAKGSSALTPNTPRDLAGTDRDEPLLPVILRTGPGQKPETLYAVALVDDLKASMAARNAQIRALWDNGTIGESADGTISARKALTADQQKLVTAENADRKALYAAEATAKKQPLDDVVLGYYIARLGYAKKGAWYEKKDAAGKWQWVQWAS